MAELNQFVERSLRVEGAFKMTRNRLLGFLLFAAFWVVLIVGAILLLRTPRDDDKPRKRQQADTGKKDDSKKKGRANKATPLENRVSAEDPMRQDQRQFLWKVEHHGNVLSQHGFKQLNVALKSADAKQLHKILSKGFKGVYPSVLGEVEIDARFARARRRTLAGNNRVQCNASQFVAQLMKLRAEFKRPPDIKFSLRNFAPKKRDNLTGTWIGTCLVRLWQEVSPGKPGEVAMEWEYEVEQPTVESIKKGNWLSGCRVLQIQTARADRFLMKEVAAKRGIVATFLNDNWTSEKELDGSAGTYLCDYNRDGILDMLIAGESFRLYQGSLSGRFRNVTAETQLLRLAKSGVAAPIGFADLDGDGWEDLMFGTQVFRNRNGKTFEDVTDRTNLKVPNGASNVIFADYDRDGKVDLYFAVVGFGNAHSWLDGTSANPSINQLWKNNGNWLFEDTTVKTNTAAGHRSTFSSVWLDADNDSWPDLYVINEFGNGVLLLNKSGKEFSQHLIVDGPTDFGSMGVTCGDINNDGKIDIYEASMYSKAGTRVIANVANGTYTDPVMRVLRTFVSGSQLHLNQGKHQFTQVGTQYQVAAVGWSYGAALVDLDNDGWLDVHATCGHMSRDRTKPDG